MPAARITPSLIGEKEGVFRNFSKKTCFERDDVDRKQLVRDVKRAALARMESAARTAEDFQAVIEQWDNLDQNRERKERFHEIGRDESRRSFGTFTPCCWASR